jgi:hypothetical protein
MPWTDLCGSDLIFGLRTAMVSISIFGFGVTAHGGAGGVTQPDNVPVAATSATLTPCRLIFRDRTIYANFRNHLKFSPELFECRNLDQVSKSSWPLHPVPLHPHTSQRICNSRAKSLRL